MNNEINTLGGYKTIDAFVTAKLNRFNAAEHSFSAMFELMFSEKDNIIYEKSSGYRIEYTTYGEAYDHVAAFAERFGALASSLPRDSVVGLYMANDIDWIIAFWAILKSGHRPLLMNTRLSDEILARALDDAQAQLVISDGKIFSGYRTVTFAEVMQYDRSCACGGFGSEILVMSSGTTASPKICAYSAEEFYYQINDSYHIITECSQIKKHYDGSLKLLTFLPFYHVFGLIAVYIWFSFFSRTFVHLADFSSQTILNTIRRHKVTHIFAVPMFWNEVYKQAIKTIKSRGSDVYERFCKGMAIAKRIGDIPVIGDAFIKAAFREVRENLFGESICFLITGGSEISAEVLSFFNLIGYHLANGYGMTEIGITSVELSSKRSTLNSGFVGKPLSSVEYSVSEDGILMVRGRSTAKYIIENGQKRERPEWFETRDLAECINGHYRILGRQDDVVIADNGENLNPCLIEPLLADDAAYQLCLIGASQKNGVQPVLLVSAGSHITTDKYEAVRAEITEKLRDNNLSSLIRKIVFIKEPLMTADDIKINRTRLSKQYETGQLTAVTPENISDSGRADSEIAEYVRGLFAAAFDKPVSEIGFDTDFFLDEGGTSLDYFALVTKIQEDHGISFPAGQEKTLTTVRELCGFIEDGQKHVV